MSSRIKNHSKANRNIMLLMILFTPLVGLAAYMIAVRTSLAPDAGWKVTAAVVAVWWMAIFGYVRWQRWRAHHTVP
ncbi:MAG: hypothetical protein ABI321_13520 [Polyangia bacterium]